LKSSIWAVDTVPAVIEFTWQRLFARPQEGAVGKLSDERFDDSRHWSMIDVVPPEHDFTELIEPFE